MIIDSKKNNDIESDVNVDVDNTTDVDTDGTDVYDNYKLSMLKNGDSGSEVTILQQLLQQHVYPIEPNGNFDDETEIYVITFQKDSKLVADGIVGNKTWSELQAKDYNPKDPLIEDRIYMLQPDEYAHALVRKKQVFLHHTAGGASAINTIDGWENDATSNGRSYRVATAYVVSREYSRYGQNLKDGDIVKCFDPKYYAWHLGKSANSPIEPSSIGIEICSWGGLTLSSGGRFVTWANTTVQDKDVYEHHSNYFGYKYFQKYTDAQIESTYKILKAIRSNFTDLSYQTSFDEDWFAYKPEIRDGRPGIWTHVNVRETGKHDVFPQPEMIQMLNTL